MMVIGKTIKDMEMEDNYSETDRYMMELGKQISSMVKEF